jgi:hypothetical protein
MVQHCEQIVWVPVRGRRHSKEKANFQPSVDFLSLGSGNGKRNQTNSRPRPDVSKSI